MKSSVISIAAALILASTWWSPSSKADSPTSEVAGIRIVGQALDGTLVLDGSVSGLSGWVTPGLAVSAESEMTSAPTLLVLGHVESWDSESNVLTVSGQRITLSDSATIIDAPRDVLANLTAENFIWYLHEGSYIAVAGDSFGGGESLASHIVRLDNDAKPGTVPLYIRGSLDFVDQLQGVAYVGNMALDLNSALSRELPQTGNVIELLAYHADAGSAVVTELSTLESIRHRGDRTRLAGINGSGLKGINGSGLKGINGSGLKGINGSGLKGINGSGLKGINGSGLKGINGSGLKGINGSGLKGINGSGLKGINGSGLKGINGSGLKGINGSGLKGINGSGLKGINGSGLKGINGSGLK